jgi:hypothetical protein
MSEDIDKMFEALSVEKSYVEPKTPPFTNLGNWPDWWNWFGAYAIRNHTTRKLTDDVEYRNTEGKLHRLYGPAYISETYNVEAWYKDGNLHRLGGPAYVHNLNMAWFVDGKLSRLDGPAVVGGGVPKQYWIDGIKFSKKQYNWEIARRKRKGLIK